MHFSYRFSTRLAFVLVFCISGVVQAQDFVFPDSFIDLGDIVAGGDGRGTGGGFDGEREFTGINIDSGEFLEEPLWGGGTVDGDGINPSPVEGSDLVDSVFYIVDPQTPLNSEGVVFQWGDENVEGESWGHILSNVTASNGENEENWTVFAGDYQFPRCVSAHADAGITFDLDEIRAEHPDPGAVHSFATFPGIASDVCVEGWAHFYVIYSTEEEILESHRISNVCAAFLDDNCDCEGCQDPDAECESTGFKHLSTIPDDAVFLTLAITRAENGWCCDFGVFANAFIIPETEIEDCAQLDVSPGEITLVKEQTRQLRVACVDSIGYPAEATSPDTGTTYASGDDTIATVDENGAVTSVKSGSTQITVTNGDSSIVVPVNVVTALDLGDLVAGGDGTGTGGGPNGDGEYWGINLNDGAFLTQAEVEVSFVETFNDNGENPVEVDSDFVDVVFFIDRTRLNLNSEGARFSWLEDDTAPGSLGPVLSNLTHQFEGGTTSINIGGRRDWSTAVGLHSAAGVTFDLEALRGEHGADKVHTFSTVAGTPFCETQVISLYVIYSDENGIVDDPSVLGSPFRRIELGIGSGERYLAQIPDEAVFLTLAAGAVDGSTFCDYGVFANPRILAESEVEVSCEGLEVSELLLRPQGEGQLRVSCVEGGGLVKRDVTAGSTGTTYSVTPEGIVTVDENGLVTAVALGEAEVTATHEGIMAVGRVLVSDSICDSVFMSTGDFLLCSTGSRQLSVTCIDKLGVERDVTSEGAIYTVDPEGVVTVDENGLVSAVRLGNAQITATVGDLSAAVNATVAPDFVDLGDVVAGGDGCGSGGGLTGDSQFEGVNTDTGEFITQVLFEDTAETDGINPSPVAESSQIDVVFFMNQTQMAVNSAGVVYEWPVEDVLGISYDNILSNRTHEGPLMIGGQSDWSTAVSVHSAAGITFDLEAIRGQIGDALTFSTFAGMQDCDFCDPPVIMTQYIIYSNDAEILDELTFTQQLGSNEGSPYEAQIPPEASFLTLASGAANGDYCCDGGAYANARIFAESAGPIFKRGDSNANGNLDIGDPILNLGHQFLGDEARCRDALDYNDSGTIDLTDPIANLGHQFLGSAPPEAPGKGACGLDPTDDDGIDCADYPEDKC